MANRHEEAERDDTVGEGTFPLFLIWFLLLTAACAVYFVVGVLDA